MNIIEKNTKKLTEMLVINELKDPNCYTKEELFVIMQKIINDIKKSN